MGINADFGVFALIDLHGQNGTLYEWELGTERSLYSMLSPYMTVFIMFHSYLSTTNVQRQRVWTQRIFLSDPFLASALKKTTALSTVWTVGLSTPVVSRERRDEGAESRAFVFCGAPPK